MFDTRVARVHSLNPTAAAVWQACDGTRDREALAAHCGLDPLGVDLALDGLAGCELLVEFTPALERVSRRTMLRRAAVTGAAAGVALPVIRSIAAPSAAMAASGGCPGGCPTGHFRGPGIDVGLGPGGSAA